MHTQTEQKQTMIKQSFSQLTVIQITTDLYIVPEVREKSEEKNSKQYNHKGVN